MRNQQRRRTIVAAASLIAIISQILAPVASADTGTMTVTAANSAKFSLTVAAASANFGTTLTPAGDASDQTGVSTYVDGNTGAYYVLSGSASTYGNTLTVRSNKAWLGSVQATENPGTAGMTLAGGSLLWKLGDVSGLSDAQNGTAFATSADNTVFNTASSCASGATKSPGVCTYNFDYALRVLWTDAPGTFTTTVTYTASQ